MAHFFDGTWSDYVKTMFQTATTQKRYIKLGNTVINRRKSKKFDEWYRSLSKSSLISYNTVIKHVDAWERMSGRSVNPLSLLDDKTISLLQANKPVKKSDISDDPKWDGIRNSMGVEILILKSGDMITIPVAILQKIKGEYIIQ